MDDLIEVNFDPNAAIAMVATITFGIWKYRKTMTQDVMVGPGWVHWIEGACIRIYGALPDDGEYPPQITLTDPTGDALICDDEEYDEEGWLMGMVIGATLAAPALQVPS